MRMVIVMMLMMMASLEDEDDCIDYDDDDGGEDLDVSLSLILPPLEISISPLCSRAQTRSA